MPGTAAAFLERLPALRLLAPYAIGIFVADRLQPSPRLCVCLIAASLGALSWRRLQEVVECGLAVFLGALALALPLSGQAPTTGERLVDLRLLGAPSVWGAGCRGEAWLLGPVSRRVLVEGPRELCRWLPGQVGRARVEIEALRGPRNPGAIDWRRRWVRRGVRARARVRESLLVRGPPPQGVSAALERTRRAIGEALDPPGARSRAGALLLALTVGDRSRLGPEVLEAFQSSGTRHLLAISGLHIGWLLGLARFGMGVLLRGSGVLAWQRRVSAISGVTGALAALGYALLAGFGTPTFRALVMAWAGALAVLGGRPQHSASALVLAALAVLAVDPAALFEPGLWLSVLAVTGILLWRPAGGALWSGIGCTLGASLATLPVLASLGAALPAGTLLANALEVPWVGTVVVPLGLASGLLGAIAGEPVPGLGNLAHAAAEIAIRLAQSLESPDLLRGIPHPVVAGLGIGMGGLLLRVRGRPRLAHSRTLRRMASAVSLACVALGFLPVSGSEVPELWLFDVGHGDAILVRAGEGSWLIDAGPAWSGSDAGRSILAPALRSLGIARLDALWLTHADRDHVGGARSLLRALPVGEIRVGLDTLRDPGIAPLVALAAQRGVPLRVVSAGDHFRLGSLEAQVLWPPAEPLPGPFGRHSNDLSLVLRIESESECLWLAGDAGAGVERRLAARGSSRRCAILKLAHHGSATSTDPALLARLDPDLALASTGRRRRAPLPARAVRSRLARAQVTLWTTARFGALRLRLSSPPTVSPYVLDSPSRSPHAEEDLLQGREASGPLSGPRPGPDEYTSSMARRPPNVDRDTWLAERERIWRRRNRWLSLLMLGAIAALAWRYFH